MSLMRPEDSRNLIVLRALFYVQQNYCFAILRPLQAEILSRGGAVRWFFVGDEINPDYLSDSEIALPSVSTVRQWQPDVVFVPGDTVTRAIPGLKVEVFHGFAAGKNYGKNKDAHFIIRNCFDLYCTHGPSNTAQFQQLAEEHGHFRVVETGWPMVDPLFSPATDNTFVNSSDRRPTVLFCSTFSRRYSCAETLYDTVRELKDRGRFRWLVQFHPKMAADTVRKYREITDENLRFIETDNVIPLLQSADVMLCDTSSILMMFLLLHKPVVTFRNQNPGPQLIDISDPAELEQALESGLSEDAQRDAAIRLYAEQIHPHRDGRSSARVVDAVERFLSEGLQLPRSKPLNLIRELKMRRQLNFWWP